MLREIISRCKTIKYCADNFTQDFGLDIIMVKFVVKHYLNIINKAIKFGVNIMVAVL